MSGPRLVMPHFSETDAEVMADLTEEGHPWVDETSEARRKEERAVPSDEIRPMDYITRRVDKPARGD